MKHIVYNGEKFLLEEEIKRLQKLKIRETSTNRLQQQHYELKTNVPRVSSAIGKPCYENGQKELFYNAGLPVVVQVKSQKEGSPISYCSSTGLCELEEKKEHLNKQLRELDILLGKLQDEVTEDKKKGGNQVIVNNKVNHAAKNNVQEAIHHDFYNAVGEASFNSVYERRPISKNCLHNEINTSNRIHNSKQPLQWSDKSIKTQNNSSLDFGTSVDRSYFIDETSINKNIRSDFFDPSPDSSGLYDNLIALNKSELFKFQPIEENVSYSSPSKPTSKSTQHNRLYNKGNINFEIDNHQQIIPTLLIGADSIFALTCSNLLAQQMQVTNNSMFNMDQLIDDNGLMHSSLYVETDPLDSHET